MDEESLDMAWDIAMRDEKRIGAVKGMLHAAGADPDSEEAIAAMRIMFATGFDIARSAGIGAIIDNNAMHAARQSANRRN